jgi:hypothetical protein
MNQPLIDYLALLEENKRLTEGKELDNQLIIDLGRQLKSAQEKIKRLEATIHDMRMREESNTSGSSEPGGISGALHRVHAREPMQRACIGD